MDMRAANAAGREFRYFTAPGVFSPGGLDAGTRLLLESVIIPPGAAVLDLGCGAGPVGIFAALAGARVSMSDIDPECLDLARAGLSENGVRAELFLSDGFADIPVSGFDLILSNPPYHSDYSVAKSFIEKGFNRLKIGGRMALVVKRPLWYKNKLISVFGGVKVISENGYAVLISEKRGAGYARREKHGQGKAERHGG